MKLSTYIKIPKGMYFIPKVSRALKTYRYVLALEKKNKTVSEIIEHVKSTRGKEWMLKILNPAFRKMNNENK